MALQQVHPKKKPIELHFQFTGKTAAQHGIRHRKPFEFSGSNIVAFNDRARLQYALQHGCDFSFALIHAKRRSLQHQDVLVLVANQSAQEIAFRIDNPK